MPIYSPLSCQLASHGIWRGTAYMYTFGRGKVWGGSCKTVLCWWGFLWRLIFYANICFLTFSVNSLLMVTTKMPLRLLAKLVLLWLQIVYLTRSRFFFGTVHFLKTCTKHSVFPSVCQLPDQFSYNGVKFYIFTCSVTSMALCEQQREENWFLLFGFVWILSCVLGNRQLLETHNYEVVFLLRIILVSFSLLTVF